MLIYGEKLRIFLFKKRIRQKIFAKVMGVHPTTVSDSWIKKGIKPQYYNADKMVSFTKGYITLKDCGYE